MFRVLGAVVVLYVLYAAVVGKIFAKAGIRGRLVHRTESPTYFWIVAACYVALGVALITVF
jgi:hypothetical protein